MEITTKLIKHLTIIRSSEEEVTQEAYVQFIFSFQSISTLT